MIRQLYYPESKNCPRGVKEAEAYLEDIKFLTKYFDDESKSKAKESEAKTDKALQEFETLVKEWKRATSHLSYTTHKITHRNYLRIIGMGEKVLPFILKELKQNPSGSWFPALQAISGVNITQKAKSIREAVDLWLKWGKQNQYL